MSNRALPKWLSPPLRGCLERLIGPVPRDESDPAVRLSTDERMRLVWAKLTENGATDEDLCNFAWYVCFSLGYWQTLEEDNLLLPRREAEKRYRKILEAIDQLIDLLNKNHLLVVDWSPEESSELHALRDRIQRHSLFWDRLPTRMNAKNAKRTFLMRVLKDRVQKKFGRPLHSVIADTINVVFNTHPEVEVTEDDVRKA